MVLHHEYCPVFLSYVVPYVIFGYEWPSRRVFKELGSSLKMLFDLLLPRDPMQLVKGLSTVLVIFLEVYKGVEYAILSYKSDLVFIC